MIDQLAAAPQNFSQVIGVFVRLIQLLIPIIGLAALLVFFWGLAKFVFSAGDVKTHEEGKGLIIWGIIGIFIMLSLFGILRLAYGDFGFSKPFGLPLLPPYTVAQ